MELDRKGEAAMSDETRCMKCGGTDLKPGMLTAPGVCAFVPEGGSAISHQNSVVPGNRATVCLDCGFLEVSCDPEAARATIKRIEEQ